MNWNLMCPGCMHELTEEEVSTRRCPHCGFEPAEEERGQALPSMTILSGKYLVGRVLETDETSITYLAYDINIEIKIKITEYFAPVLAKRGEGGRRVVPISPEREEALKEGKKNYLDNTRQIVKLVTQSGKENLVRDFFEENNTVYAVLIDKTASPVTAMPDKNLKERLKEEQARLKKKNRKKRVFFLTGAGIVLAAAAVVLFLFGFGKKAFRAAGGHGNTWQPVYQASELGALYDDSIMIFAVNSSLYYGEYNAEGWIPAVRWLAELEVNETLYSAAVDGKYLYVSVTNYGIWRAAVEEEEAAYTQVVARNALDFILYKDSIYYAVDNVLYCAGKDGSGERVISDNASNVFTLYQGMIYYYSAKDGKIYQAALDEEEPAVLTEQKNITGMLAAGDTLYTISSGRLYRIDPQTGLFLEPEGIADVGSNSEILFLNGKLYYAAPNYQKVYACDMESGESYPIYDGSECVIMGVFGDRILFTNSIGEYWQTDEDMQECSRLDFNYLSMEEDCVE